MFLYKKRDILAGIITLFILFGSTTISSAAESTQTDITQPIYGCPGEPVDGVNGTFGDEFTQYTENTTGDGEYSRYFYFQTQVDGDITININKNGTKQEIYIGTSCNGTQIHKGRRNTTNYSGNFPVSSGTTYYVRVREKNRNNHINFTITFDFTAPIVAAEPMPEPTPVDPSATAQLIYDDMYLDHEGYPHGVPSHYDFAQGPMIKDAAESVGDFQAMAGWGQVYEEINGNPSVNTRVELKNYKAYYLSKSDNKWHELAVVENITEGAAYPEDYGNDDLHPGGDTIRFEPNGHVSCNPGSGFNFHFYTSRLPINPSDVAQMATSFNAKLIMADPNVIDDRSTAKFVAASGADVWRTMTATFSPDFSNNHDIGMGRFKYVTNEWRTFTFITDMPLAQLQENPPPLQ